jgi:hypothetical protein
MSMANPLIHFAAQSGAFALFGLAESPLARVNETRSIVDLPIEITSMWIIPHEERNIAITEIHDALRDYRAGAWYAIPRDGAVAALAAIAKRHGGVEVPVPDGYVAQPREHYLSRAVITPEGRFGSARKAGDAFGITRQAAWDRAHRRVNGWRFESEEESAS